MTHEQDPLDELRAGWRALEPPAAVRPLVDEDARTRAAVGWMASAWEALEAPEPGPLPRALPDSILTTVERGPRVVSRLALALAAGLLAWFGFAVSRPGQGPSTPRTAAPPIALSTPVEHTALEQASAPIVLAANEERVELRSGSVRLVLLQPLAKHAGGTPR